MADGHEDNMQTVDHIQKNLHKLQDNFAQLNKLQLKAAQVEELCMDCEETDQRLKAEQKELAELEAQMKLLDSDPGEASEELLEQLQASMDLLEAKVQWACREAAELAAEVAENAQQGLALEAAMNNGVLPAEPERAAWQQRDGPLLCGQEVKRPKEADGAGAQEVPSHEEAIGDLWVEDSPLREEVAQFF